jgi:hypothetical protein
VRRPPEPGNEAPEATGGGPKTLDAISVSSFLSAPSGKTYGTGRQVDGSTRLSTNNRRGRRIVSTKFGNPVDKLWMDAVGDRRGGPRSAGQPPIANISTLGRDEVVADVAADRNSEYRSSRRDHTASMNAASASSEAPPRITSRTSVPSTAKRQV